MEPTREGAEPGSPHPSRRAIVVTAVTLAVGLIALVALVDGGGSPPDESADAEGTVLSEVVESSSTTTSTTRPVATSSTQPSSTRAAESTRKGRRRADKARKAAADRAAEAAAEPVATPPPQDSDAPAVVARPVPVEPPPPPPEAPPPPWAASRFVTSGGHLSTDVGCVEDLSAPSLDAFFAGRVGPVLGWDYQHVYDLGGGRHLWLFQDTFIDQSGTAETLDRANFVHNAALIQEGRCFRLLHRGDSGGPTPFELGNGTATLRTWFWPMGGEVHDGILYVFWAEMTKDAVDPQPPDGLGWHPAATHLAMYDPVTLKRLDFRRAPNPGAAPIYGYAVASDRTHTYLFGNTFEQNLAREGGFWNGPHSGTLMYLARVPRGRLQDAPEYWTPKGWRSNSVAARSVLSRHWAEFPMQPRWVGGQWVAATAVNGYWGDEYTLDVARDPWGPWTTVESRPLSPRGADPLRNTYHAHVLPWRDGFGGLVVAVSNNARDMLRDAWPVPARYRPVVFRSPWQQAPPPTTTTTTTTTTTSTTTAPRTTRRPTTRPPRTTRPSTTTTMPSPDTTAPPTGTTTTTTTLPQSTSTVPQSSSTVPGSTSTTTSPTTSTTLAVGP